MEAFLPLLFAAVIGFGHAFEVDHLIAVGNIVNRHQRISASLKDGFFWGLGHSSTVLLIGGLIILGDHFISPIYFDYFEGLIGLLLIFLGLDRLRSIMQTTKVATTDEKDDKLVAYGVGLVHGLAGSGAMVLLVMGEVDGDLPRIIFLLLFGLGSVIGMMLAASVLGLPFLQRFTLSKQFRNGLAILYALICLSYGSWLACTKFL